MRLFTTTFFGLTILYLLFAGCTNQHTNVATSELTARENPAAKNSAFMNGKWFTDSGEFESRTFYSVNGLFTTSEPARIDTVLDLEGAFVVPPFSDAHNHAFADSYSIGFSQELFLNQGFFYAMNLTNPYSGYESVRDTVSQPQTIDVIYSHGGISTNKGSRPHPATVMERSYSYLSGEDDNEWPLEGNAYWFMETNDQIEQKWPLYIAQNPDVVKVYIIRYGEDDPDLPECGYGLCPEQLKMIIDSANAAGKRVFAHVNTAKDFQLALDTGVDGITHLPLGNDGLTIADVGPLTLADSTIQQAGEMEIILTPTAHLLTEDFESFPTDTLTDAISLQREQLQKLRDAGVTIALGADGWSSDPLREAMHLHAYDMFSNDVLLRILTEDTPIAIFPDRKFAALQDGFEASFVALSCNPIEDFQCIKEVTEAVKQGMPVLTTE